jgi:hypothetical protein
MDQPQSPVRSTTWFKGFPSATEAVTWLQKHLRATPVAGTALIEVFIDTDLPANESALIVNEIASEYLERQRKQSTDTLVEQIDLLTNLKNRYEALANKSRGNQAPSPPSFRSTGWAVRDSPARRSRNFNC